MELGIGIADRDLSPDLCAGAVRLADEAGLHSVWTNETGGADACVTLGAWSQIVQRAVLGTGVVPLSARSTATLALAGRQLAALLPDRLLLGIGVGQRGAAEHVHQREWRSPLEWTADALTQLRGDDGPKVIVGALGPRMVELAASKADGALLNWTTPDHARRLRETFRDAADAAGRSPDDVLLAGYVRVSVGAGAAAAMKGQIGFYSSLPFYQEHWEDMGNPPDSEVGLVSGDGSDLRRRLAQWDALDVVVARLVPSESHDVRRTVEALVG